MGRLIIRGTGVKKVMKIELGKPGSLRK